MDSAGSLLDGIDVAAP